MYDNMDRPTGYSDKSEKQIHDFTYMWNLKTNKTEAKSQKPGMIWRLPDGEVWGDGQNKE